MLDVSVDEWVVVLITSFNEYACLTHKIISQGLKTCNNFRVCH
jgi:hypothetical protein